MNGDPNRVRRQPARPQPPGVETSDEFLVRHGLLHPAPRSGGPRPGRPGGPAAAPPPHRRPPENGSATPGYPSTQRDDPRRPGYDQAPPPRHGGPAGPPRERGQTEGPPWRGPAPAPPVRPGPGAGPAQPTYERPSDRPPAGYRNGPPPAEHRGGPPRADRRAAPPVGLGWPPPDRMPPDRMPPDRMPPDRMPPGPEAPGPRALRPVDPTPAQRGWTAASARTAITDRPIADHPLADRPFVDQQPTDRSGADRAARDEAFGKGAARPGDGRLGGAGRDTDGDAPAAGRAGTNGAGTNGTADPETAGRTAHSGTTNGTSRAGRRDADGTARPRAVGASGTGRSVARAQADARTARVPARSPERAEVESEDRAAARRSVSDPPSTDGGARRRRATPDDGSGAEVVEQAAEPRTSRTGSSRGGSRRAGTVREVSARDVSAQDDAAQDGAALDGAAQDDNGRNGTGRNGTARNGARRARARRAADLLETDDPVTDADGPDTEGPAAPRPERDSERLRADRIDLTLTRLTAAHAGLSLADFARPDEDRDGHADDEQDGADEDLDTAALRARAAVWAARGVAAAVALLLVVVSGTGWVGRTRLDRALHRVAAVDVAPDGVLDAAAQAGDSNVLLLATDSGGSAGATTRADSVTVVHVDTKGGHAVAVTLPPDLEITRPPCERWDAAASAYSGQTVPAEPRTTLAGAYTVGGPRCATRAVQQVTGLAITRFAAVDLAATSALVESVGGVDVCVERPVLDTVLGSVLPTAGESSLNGARASDLVRAADIRDDPAPETGLVQRQQRVLAAVLARALSPTRLLNPGRVGRLLPALGTTVVSTGTGVDDLLTLSRTLARTDTTTLRAAPTDTAANSRGNRVLRDADAAALFAAVRTDGPLPPVDTTPDQPAATAKDVTADVLNASGRDGLAAQVAGTLGDLGFRTAQVTNAPRPALDTVVRFSPDRAVQAQLLAAAVPSASAVPDPGKSGELQLVLGRSFDGTVRAAAAPSDTDDAAPTTPAMTCS